MRRNTPLRCCLLCGRALQVGEVCNCDQPVAGLPKDGLRAHCPNFIARSSYRGKYYIECRVDVQRSIKVPYGNAGDRNAHYRDCCCGNNEDCSLYCNEDNKEDEKP